MDEFYFSKSRQHRSDDVENILFPDCESRTRQDQTASEAEPNTKDATIDRGTCAVTTAHYLSVVGVKPFRKSISRRLVSVMNKKGGGPIEGGKHFHDFERQDGLASRNNPADEKFTPVHDFLQRSRFAISVD
jgi:hypothetical protein